MLPRWLSLQKDNLTIFIRPDSIVVRRFKGFIGAQLSCVDQQKIVLKKKVGYSDLELAYLTQVLQTTLNTERWQAASATIVLSNQFVRYAVIPWNAEIKNNEESRAFLRHQFLTIYGDAIASWNMCQSPAEYGQKALASAVPSELLQTINDVFSSLQITLDSVQPSLMHIANQAQEVINQQNLQKSYWLAVIADGRLCLCLIVEGEWRWVKAIQVEAEETVVGQIELLIQREQLLNSVVADLAKQQRQVPILLHWSNMPNSEAVKINNHRVIRLPSSKIFSNEPVESLSARLVTS
ncbi:MAG TPA: hypothetical protein ENH74_05105 [Methylophaga sp.]|nr:hypothetical protein [Methylophaga sp.]